MYQQCECPRERLQRPRYLIRVRCYRASPPKYTEGLLSFYLTDCRPCRTWVPIQEALALDVVSSRMRVPIVLRRRIFVFAFPNQFSSPYIQRMRFGHGVI